MYPDEFQYHRADSVKDAIALLGEYPDAELLAGGHSLLPTMKARLARPEHVVDIGRVESLRGIESDGETVSIGALTTYAEVATSERVRGNASVVAEAAHAIGDRQVRNRGTVGGNLAHADPAADLPGAMLAADAVLVAQGSDGTRRIPVDGFFEGLYETALDADELLIRVDLPARPAAVGSYQKRPNPASGYAIVGVAVSLVVENDVVDSVRVAANGVVDHGVRLEPVEAALSGERLDGDTIERAAERAPDGLGAAARMDDAQTSASFREHLLSVYTKRALTDAAERAGVLSATA